MERSFSSLKYNGAIPDAITASQRQKKLLVVYVSGENEASSRLEREVWPNSQVVDIVSKFCVLLQIYDGSSDATNFAAIYPQKSIPSITVVSYNGVQLWQTDGFIEADNLAANLEKSWLSLNIQAATASYIAGALYSKSHDSLPEINSTTPASSSYIPNLKTSEPQVLENNSTTPATSSSSSSSLSPPNLKTPQPQVTESSGIEESKEEYNVNEHGSIQDPNIDEQIQSEGEIQYSEEDLGENVENKPKIDERPGGITLSIRLPDSSSLLEKFSSDDTLENVKNYVDRKVGNLRNYYLAVPYPRKVFLDEDLSKSLLQLHLFDRQALITVPKGDVSSSAKETKSVSANEGYFASVRRLLSYINPLSYLYPRANTTNQGENGTNTVSSTRIGSNVHTLKHDDKQNDGRNQYWNGNSTQYGGDDSK